MKYRTLFFSDLHLGMRGVHPEHVLHLLKYHEFDKIYCVGDIIDFWALRRSSRHWVQSHNDVIQKLLRAHRKGSVVVYIFGNHDQFLSQFDGMSFGGISVKEHDIHVRPNGDRCLVVHGHQLDTVVKYAKWLARLGDIGYSALLWLNHHFNWLRSLCGLKYWSLSKFVKSRIKSAVNFVSAFESSIVKYADSFDVDMVIAGHLHCPDIKQIDGIVYINTGDFVESISCVVEHMDGRMELLQLIDGHFVATKEVSCIP